jgi:hypothetical protein
MPLTISSVSTRRVDELIQTIDERVQVSRRLGRIFLS